MKWLVVAVLGAGALLGVGLAGGLDGAWALVGDRGVALVRALGASSLLAPSPPVRAPSPARPATSPQPAPVAAAAPLPRARIQRQPDGAPREQLTQDDRDRLNHIIDTRLPR